MGFFDNFKVAQSQNDFSVEISDSDWEADWGGLISAQTTSLEVNLVDRTLTFSLRQLKSGQIQEILFHILQKGSRKIDHIVVRPAKGAKNGYEYHFRNGEIIDHSCKFTYLKSGDLIHHITLKFAEIELKTPAKDQRKSFKIGVEHGRQQLNG